MKKLMCFSLLVLFNYTISAQQKAVSIVKKGKGTPVFMLPGFGCSDKVWDKTIQQLHGRNAYYMVNYAGFNGLSAIDMPWYETIKKELLLYIQVNQLKEIKIIGHSMGGTLALDIAASLPEMVKDIVLVDALPCMRALMMPGVTAEQLTYDNPYNNRMLTMPMTDMEKEIKIMSAAMTNSAAMADTITQWMLKADRKTYVYGYTDLLKTDLRDSLPGIKANTLILGADFPSKEAVIKTYNDQFAKLNNKQIEIAENSKHFIMFDQPEWMYRRINTFFNK